MKLSALILILSFIINSTTSAQEIVYKDSVKSFNIYKRSILPVTLIGVGLILNNSQFEKDFQDKLRDKVGEDYRFRIDDVVQYIPIAEMYLADILKVESRNHWFDQSKYLFISQLVSSLITHGLKDAIHKTRPDGSENNSMPSGHSSFAFVNATVLYNEFNNTSPLLAYSGYAFAATTGVFRVINNKHYISDVLVGAGIGILVTNLVYYFEPLKNFNPFKKSENITLIPQINRDRYGLYLAYEF